MLKVTVCIGSSCHIKGSRQVVEDLQRLIATEKLEDKVELGGTFCMGRCQEGVCVTIDDDFFSVSPETTAEFFEKENIPALKKTKKGEKEVNLRDFIQKYEITAAESGKTAMDLTLSAGGAANIKPEIVISKLEEFLNDGEFESVDIHRTQIFYTKDGEIKNFC